MTEHAKSETCARMIVKPKRGTSKRQREKRTTQRNRADRLFSFFIRHRDKACVIAGCKTPLHMLQCAHLVSRRYLVVRFDPSNAVALCVGHHKGFTHNPLAWDVVCVARLGVAGYDDLKKRALGGGKVDYADVCTDLRARLKDMGVEA